MECPDHSKETVSWKLFVQWTQILSKIRPVRQNKTYEQQNGIVSYPGEIVFEFGYGVTIFFKGTWDASRGGDGSINKLPCQYKAKW